MKVRVLGVHVNRSFNKSTVLLSLESRGSFIMSSVGIVETVYVEQFLPE